MCSGLARYWRGDYEDDQYTKGGSFLGLRYREHGSRSFVGITAENMYF